MGIPTILLIFCITALWRVAGRCADGERSLQFQRCVRWMPYSLRVSQTIKNPYQGSHASNTVPSMPKRMEMKYGEVPLPDLGTSATTGEMISRFTFSYDKGDGSQHVAAEYNMSLSAKQPEKTTAVQRAVASRCDFRWLSEPNWYDGVDRLIFIGDSTIMRDFMHVVNASDSQYITKVGKLQTGTLEGRIHLKSGREIEVFFFRLLHVATGGEAVHEAFKIATRNSLMVLGIGPHDTSWLVFRKPMPGQRKWMVGRWEDAKKYWRRHVSNLARIVGKHLEEFDTARPEDTSLNTSSGGELSRLWVGSKRKRPFFMLREHYHANCAHIKYSKYPLITRCKDMLMPTVIPYYRDFAKAAFGALNIPVVGIDPLMDRRWKGGDKDEISTPCFLIDAGHINRWPCHHAEISLLFQTFQMGRDNNVVQGFTKECQRIEERMSEWNGDLHTFPRIADEFSDFPTPRTEIVGIPDHQWKTDDVIGYVRGFDGSVVDEAKRRLNSTEEVITAGANSSSEEVSPPAASEKIVNERVVLEESIPPIDITQVPQDELLVESPKQAPSSHLLMNGPTTVVGLVALFLAIGCYRKKIRHQQL